MLWGLAWDRWQIAWCQGLHLNETATLPYMNANSRARCVYKEPPFQISGWNEFSACLECEGSDHCRCQEEKEGQEWSRGIFRVRPVAPHIPEVMLHNTWHLVSAEYVLVEASLTLSIRRPLKLSSVTFHSESEFHLQRPCRWPLSLGFSMSSMHETWEKLSLGFFLYKMGRMRKCRHSM